MPKNSDILEYEGSIVEVLTNQTFKFKLKESEHIITAYTGGKMRQNRIRLVAGDIVKIEMSPYDLQKGRITYRL